MSKGKRYELLNALRDEYGVCLTNHEFKNLIANDYLKTKNTRQLFMLIIKYGGGFRVRPEKMTLKPLESKHKKKNGQKRI